MKSLKVNAFLNVIKQSCTILFPLVTFPYVTRMLGSGGFGEYSFSYSIISYFILIAAFGISTYSIREGAKLRDNQEKLNIFASECFSINVITTIISFILLGILLIFNSKIHNYYLLIMIQSISIIFCTIGCDWINSIFEDYFYLTVRYILLQIIGLICIFVLVRTPEDLWKYCLISSFISYGGNLLNLFHFRKYVKLKLIYNKSLLSHFKPMFIFFISAIAISIYVNSDITMLGFFYDNNIVGIYSFSSKIYNIIKQLVNAVIVVAIPRLAYVQNNKDKYNEYMKKIFVALCVFLFPVCAGTFALSKEIIITIGGYDYINGTLCLQILSFAILFAILNSFMSSCVLVINKLENKCLIATFTSSIINILLNFIMLPKYGIVGASITTLLAEIVNCVIQWKYALKYYHFDNIKFNDIIYPFVSSILIVLICVIVKYYFVNEYIIVFISIVLSVLLYSFTLLLTRNQIISEIKNTVVRIIRR